MNKLESAVGIVFDQSKRLLLGLAVADDERDGKWCFVGGGIDKGEGVIDAAIREVYEESGVVCDREFSSLVFFVHPTKPKVAFCVLRAISNTELRPNEEFEMMNWFDLNRLPEPMMELNVDILKQISKMKI